MARTLSAARYLPRWLLLAIPAALVVTQGCASPGSGSGARATLGVATSVPGEELARELELKNEVRVQGRLVDAVEPGSAAELAGVQPGDVLLRLDANELYSADDIADFLAVAQPGDAVTIAFQRPGAGERTARATLGRGPAEPAQGPKLAWQHASLGQLPRALDEARAQKKKVLVGLTGAET